jgi:hypothetical protein
MQENDVLRLLAIPMLCCRSCAEAAVNDHDSSAKRTHKQVLITESPRKEVQQYVKRDATTPHHQGHDVSGPNLQILQHACNPLLSICLYQTSLAKKNAYSRRGGSIVKEH